MPTIPENIINLATNQIVENVIEIEIDDSGGGSVFVAEAKAQADRAKAYSEASDASAVQAGTYANTASEHAESASESATNASTSATNASTSASDASASATRAENARDEAESLIPGEGLVGGFLQKTTDGTAWTTIPSGGGVWGSIVGTLSDQTDLQDSLDAKQDTLVAGDNIVISDNVISASSTSTAWGSIIGTLSSQSDLQNALNNKMTLPVSSAPANYVLSKTATGTTAYTWKQIQGSNVSYQAVGSQTTNVDNMLDALFLGRQVTIFASNWSSEAVDMYGTNYYTYTINLSTRDYRLYSNTPIISIQALNEVIPTEQEQIAYNMWEYAVANVTARTITLYAKEKPTDDFKIGILGAI